MAVWGRKRCGMLPAESVRASLSLRTSPRMGDQRGRGDMRQTRKYDRVCTEEPRSRTSSNRHDKKPGSMIILMKYQDKA